MRKLINGKYVPLSQLDAAAQPEAVAAQPVRPVPTEGDVMAAIKALDPVVDAHWTQKDGLPDLNALKEALGKRISRAAVDAIMPGYTRESAKGGQ